MRAAAVIPVRYDSRRLPGKPLLRETGQFLVQHVWESASKAKSLDSVIIATDDERIIEAATQFGATAIMTSADHRSGSDRVAEVAVNLDCELVVNIQGDEPEINPEDLDRLVDRMKSGDEELGTLARAFNAEEQDSWVDPHQVKVVLGSHNRALYFSRSPIPWGKDAEGAFLHIGVYAWRRDALLQFSSTEPSPLERREKLEQLRALELGMSIAVVTTEHVALGIDTPEDYARFVERVNQHDPDTRPAQS
ncbi:MAG: 3-deoxy-manno-octulosonate cytidylyltransferase [Planctomycetota bacterium]|nr:3-deoxy-manno-octulosonate cytidylyltransferase [Planctomycetota bacterium]